MTAKASKSDESPLMDSQESRAAEAVTVAWMLTCMSTAAGMLVVFILRLIMATAPATGARQALANVSGMLLAVATLTGVLCLLFTPIALRTRRIRPPKAVVIMAVLIGLAPLLVIGLSVAGIL